MIKRLHILFIKSYIGPLLMTFFIVEFVLMMHFLWLYIEDLVGKGLEWSIVAELMLYASAGLVKMALPLAVLLASIMTFGNFGEHFELSAMKSAGISLQRIMMPLVVLSVFISIIAFFWSNDVIPYTNLKTGALLYDVSNQRPELNIKPGIFNHDIEGYSIKIKDKSQNSPMMYDFMIYDHKEKRGNPKVTLADSGFMQITENQKYIIVTLYGGRTFEEMSDKDQAKKIYPERHETFDKQTFSLELKGFDLERTDETLFKHHYQMKTIAELQFSKDSLTKILAERKEMFVSGLNKSKYFKFSRPRGMMIQQPDSGIRDRSVSYPVAGEKLKNMDTVLADLAVDEKESIMKTALDNAINAKTQVETNKVDIEERQKNINKHQIAWHEKFTLSFACLIFFFIGAPLGAIIRKGGLGLPFLVSIIFFIVYYIFSITGKKLVEESALPPWQGMWLSSLFTVPMGILFTYKATTDSVLFDIGAYVDFFKRPFKVLQIQYKDPSIVFHKNVEIPVFETIDMNINEMDRMLNSASLHIDDKTKNFRGVYLSNFQKDQSELKQLVDSYNSLYDVLAVKYRDRLFLKASLEKFPKLNFEMYAISSTRRNLNFLFLTVLIFPLGMYFLLMNYLKMKVLKQKIDSIQNQLSNFKGASEHI